jgi:hypothetical protein
VPLALQYHLIAYGDYRIAHASHARVWQGVLPGPARDDVLLNLPYVPGALKARGEGRDAISGSTAINYSRHTQGGTQQGGAVVIDGLTRTLWLQNGWEGDMPVVHIETDQFLRISGISFTRYHIIDF